MPLTLYPYRLGSCWVFDDQRTGLKEEAFILGTSEMISRVIERKRIPDAARGFALTFDSAPFDHDLKLVRCEGPHSDNPIGQLGTWYQADVLSQQMTGWLCPALLL